MNIKRLLVLTVTIGMTVVAAKQIADAIHALRELKKQREKTERRKKELEELKEKIALEKLKKQMEENKKNDPMRKEFERLVNLANKVSEATSDEELKEVFDDAMESGILEKPWKGDFREFMSNPNNTLDFS